jgi:hypothetical protein
VSRLALAVLVASILASPALEAQVTHRLVAGPETVAFGRYDPARPGVIRVRSGDFVEVTTMLTSNPTRLESMGLPPEEVQPNLRAIYDEVADRGPGGHVLTGPIHVEEPSRRRARGPDPLGRLLDPLGLQRVQRLRSRPV